MSAEARGAGEGRGRWAEERGCDCGSAELKPGWVSEVRRCLGEGKPGPGLLDQKLGMGSREGRVHF